MKHGRRHKTLKEQAYLARKDAEGYGRPYRAIDVAEPEGPPVEAPPAEVPLGLALGRKAQRQLKRKGIDPLTDE
jgi:hypothetical protein